MAKVTEKGEKHISPLIKCLECKAIVDTGVAMNLSIFCHSKLVNNATNCTNHTCKTKIA